MSIYCEKCRTRIATGNRCTTCGHINPGGVASSEVPMAPPPQMPAPGQPVYSPGVVVPSGGTFQKSLGASVTLLIFAALGAISPFLTYISGYDYYWEETVAYSGWDSQDVFSNYDEFSNGPTFVLLGSLVALGLAIAVIVNQNNSKAVNKTGFGVGTLVAGVVVALSAGISYSAWDTILREDGSSADQGIGLWLGAVSGVATLIIGIIMLTVPKVTQGSR